jgi:hypothetical protein
MGRTFGNNDSVVLDTSALPYIGTLAFWLYPTDNSSVEVYFVVRQNPGSGNIFGIYWAPGDNFYCGWAQAGDANNGRFHTPTYPLVLNNWNSIICTWNHGADRCRFYLNGILFGVSIGNAQAVTTTSPRTIGGDASNPNETGVGRYAEYAQWSTALSANDCAGLGGGACPLQVRPSSLIEYLPLWGITSPEPNLARGVVGTVTGTTRTTMPPSRTFTGTMPHQPILPAVVPPSTQLPHALFRRRAG